MVSKEVTATTTPITSKATIKQLLIIAFGKGSVMIDIASCESHYRQFNPDGSVYHGKQNPKDIGILQINEKYWLAESIRLGYDIYSVSGNIAMGKWIYDHYGNQPWHWSYEISPGYGWGYGECI